MVCKATCTGPLADMPSAEELEVIPSHLKCSV